MRGSLLSVLPFLPALPRCRRRRLERSPGHGTAGRGGRSALTGPGGGGASAVAVWRGRGRGAQPRELRLSPGPAAGKVPKRTGEGRRDGSGARGVPRPPGGPGAVRPLPVSARLRGAAGPALRVFRRGAKDWGLPGGFGP